MLNKENAPIKDLYVDVTSNQLQALELKCGYDFKCEISVDAHEMGKICGVEFDISCSLTKKE